MKIGDVNLADPDAFFTAVPYDYFAMMRHEAPVSWVPRVGDDGFWSITRYADIADVEKRPEVFSSRANILPLPIPEYTLARDIDHNIILSDPPRHGFLRRVIMSAFTQKAILGINERVRVLTTRIIDSVIESGECNLVDVAAYVPIEIVAEMLGVPESDRARLFAWADATVGSADPDATRHISSKQAAEEMFEYASRLGAERRRNPQGDIFSTIAAAKENGERLSDVDLGCFFLLLATAGTETTRTQILQGSLALIEHPDQRRKLIEDRSKLTNAIEEMLRWSTPAMCFGRKALVDTQVGGQAIKAGQQVVLWYCSGSRDESVFANPDVFDVDRHNAREHQAFGVRGSIHQCLGSMLARSELVAVFDALLERMPDMSLAGPVVRLRSNFANGIKQMPVRFTPGIVLGDGPSARWYAAENEGCPAHSSPSATRCPVTSHGE